MCDERREVACLGSSAIPRGSCSAVQPSRNGKRRVTGGPTAGSVSETSSANSRLLASPLIPSAARSASKLQSHREDKIHNAYPPQSHARGCVIPLAARSGNMCAGKEPVSPHRLPREAAHFSGCP
jgi:hypothetical protein